MVVDVFVLLALVVIFLFILKKDLGNYLIFALSLLAVAIFSRIVAVNLAVIFSRNQLAQEGYAMVMIYLLLIIIVVALLYAILSNFNLSPNKRIQIFYTLLISIIVAFSSGLIVCTVFGFLPSLKLATINSQFCRECKLTATDITQSEVLLSPESAEEVINLKNGLRLEQGSRVIENEVLGKINNERAKRSAQSLKSDSKLNELAANYAKLIIKSLRFSHLDVNNNSPADRANLAGIKFAFLGENLAIASDIDTAHNALMKSDSHRANIVSEKYNHVGIAVYSLSDGMVLLIEEFAD